MHPEGTFEAEIVAHGTQTAETGTPGVWMKFATEHGFVRGDLWVTEKTAKNIARRLRNCGFSGTSTVELDSEVLCGNMVIIKVTHETFKGKTSAKVAEIYTYTNQSASSAALDAALAERPEAAAVVRRDPAESLGIEKSPDEEVPF